MKIKKSFSLFIVVVMVLFGMVIVDIQFKQTKNLQVKVYNGEIKFSNALFKEFRGSFATGTILTYGTSTIAYKLYDSMGLTLSLSLPLIGSVYLKIAEVWRKSRVYVFQSVFPIGFLLGSCFGMLILAFQFAIIQQFDKSTRLR
jgi:hypothetical protein